MPIRTDDEVIAVLAALYDAEFAGKAGQRFLLSWADLRAIYGYGNLYETRFQLLVEAASRRRFYLFDLGQTDDGRMIAVIRKRTVNRWRRVPRKIVDDYRRADDADNDGEDEIE